MPKTLEAIAQDVLELSRPHRLALAQLIFDLEAAPSEPRAEDAWNAEIRGRLKACDEGRVETIPYETLRVEMERRFGR